MEWGLKNSKDFGFNDWGKNIIIIYTKQHDSHLKFTDRVRNRINTELPNIIKEKGMRGGYKALNNMLK